MAESSKSEPPCDLPEVSRAYQQRMQIQQNPNRKYECKLVKPVQFYLQSFTSSVCFFFPDLDHPADIQ